MNDLLFPLKCPVTSVMPDLLLLLLLVVAVRSSEVMTRVLLHLAFVAVNCASDNFV